MVRIKVGIRVRVRVCAGHGKGEGLGSSVWCGVRVCSVTHDSNAHYELHFFKYVIFQNVV